MKQYASFILMIALGAGCGGESSSVRDSGDDGNRTGIAGFERTVNESTEPEGPLTTPSGRIVVPGTRDHLGYVLPLDVRRPRPERTLPPGPTKASILAARNKAAPGFFEEHRLNADDGHTQNETSIGVHGDTLVAGWNNFTATTLLMGVARSVDGGNTWTDTILAGHGVMSDPTIKPGENGKWYYGYLADGGSGGSDIDIYVRRSLDGGATWLAPTLVTGNGSFDDKPYIDAKGDEVLVGWANFSTSPSKVWAARSIDGGQAYGQNQIVSVNSGNGNGACPVIDHSGVYYMFWRDSFQESLWVARSVDQGATWSPDRGIVAMNPLPSMLPGGFRIVNLPSADSDPITGDLVVVWNDQRFGNPDILSIRSVDGGATWNPPVRVNDDAGTEAQWFPWVTIDETGIVHVTWYDRRHDGSDIDVYYARSLDGGITYEANIRVTAASFTPVLPWDANTNFIGDYNGIAATASAAFPFYQDSREGNQDVYVAIVPTVSTGVSGEGRLQGRDAEAARLIARPTPFREETTISFAKSSAGHVAVGGTIDVFTASGRLVQTLPIDSGLGSARWNGRDRHGREMPAGIYFARWRGSGGEPESAAGTASARIVKVR